MKGSLVVITEEREHFFNLPQLVVGFEFTLVERLCCCCWVVTQGKRREMWESYKVYTCMFAFVIAKIYFS